MEPKMGSISLKSTKNGSKIGYIGVRLMKMGLLGTIWFLNTWAKWRFQKKANVQIFSIPRGGPIPPPHDPFYYSD